MKREDKTLEIVNKLGNIFKKSNFTKRMYCIGSFSTGHFDKYADLDIVITTNRNVGSKDILPLITEHMSEQDQNKCNSTKPNIYRIDPKINGIKVMLFFILDKLIISNLKSYNKVKEHEIDKQRDSIRTKKAIVVFDKDNTLRKFKKKTPVYPNGMKKFILHERISKLDYILFLEGGAINVERKRGHILETNFLLSDTVYQIFEIIYALNNQILIDRKWAIQEISKFKKKPRGFSAKLIKIYNLGNSDKGLNLKIKILREITKNLKKLIEKENVKNLPNLCEI